MTDQTVSMLKLVKRKDADNSDIDSLDFLSLPTELQYQGWNQGLTQTGKPSVDESITLLMNAGNANTLATSLQAIDTKIKEINWAQDPLNPIGVWLRSQLQGETGQRQAFVLSANRPPGGLKITHPLAYQNVVPDYTLGLTRMPKWENVTATTINGGTISANGGTVSYTIAGDAHARISQVQLNANITLNYNDVWLGVKSGRYGVNPANFVPVWNLYIGKRFTDVGAYTADATALAGNKYVCTFATTTTMTYRVVIKTSDVTANLSDQRGKYNVLLRAKTSDASLVTNVRVGNGYLNPVDTPASFAFLPRYQISAANTGWQYFPLGQVKIPAAAGFSDTALNSSALAIQAEKVSGSGNLELDSLILIPAEHNIHATLAFGISNLIGAYIYTRPDLRLAAVSYGTNTIYQSAAPDAIEWSLPSGSGVIVCAASYPTTVNSDTLAPVFTIYPSYNSLRGSA